MNEYLVNSEALIIEGQTLLAKKLGLPDKKLEESEILMMERGLGQHMLMLQSQLRGKIKYIPHYLDSLSPQDRMLPSRWPRKSSSSRPR